MIARSAVVIVDTKAPGMSRGLGDFGWSAANTKAAMVGGTVGRKNVRNLGRCRDPLNWFGKYVDTVCHKWPSEGAPLWRGCNATAQSKDKGTPSARPKIHLSLI